VGRFRTRWFSQVLEDNRKRENKSKRKDCWKKEEIGNFSSIDMYKTEMILEEDRKF
jgi:hypothetical protein